MLIPTDDVSRILAEITQAAEDHNAAVSTLIATENGFEGWWKGALVAGLASPPWSRQPGWDAANTNTAGVSMESTVEVADGRLTFSRRSGRNEKRIDIPGYLAELEVEIDNAEAWTGAVIVKRRGSPNVNDWYAVMPAKIWAELLAMLDEPTRIHTTPPN
jgi:hypothetical protein